MIYTKEAHPAEVNPAEFSRDSAGQAVNQGRTYEERVALALKTVSEAALKMLVLVDQMDNPAWCTYGRMPNSAFLIGQDGRVVLRQQWNDAGQLDRAISSFLAGRAP